MAASSLDLDSDPRVIIGTREFDAPRELVWQAWSDPKHLSQWWGPDGFTTTTNTFEMRPGGVWRFVMHGPDGRDYENRVTFDEVVKPERLAYHHGGGDDVEPVQFRTIVTFEDLHSDPRMPNTPSCSSCDRRHSDRPVTYRSIRPGDESTVP